MHKLYFVLITALCLNLAKCGLLQRPKRSMYENDIENEGINDSELPDGAGSSASNGVELPVCFETEPCQFVFVKKNPRDNLPLKKTIPSWCQCNASEECVQVVYDRKRKMEVYRCETLERQQQRRQQTANTTTERKRRHQQHQITQREIAFLQNLYPGRTV